MNVVLLRVGIDTGCGGIHSPLFSDGSFEFLPIPDSRNLDERTYGNTVGRQGRPWAEYFPRSAQGRVAKQAMHVDPEFETFTYGDPTPPKRGLARLKSGDLLVFYAGMTGWKCEAPQALYLFAFFNVKLAGIAWQFTERHLHQEFGRNFHVRHRRLFAEQRERLVLVKGGRGSRLFHKAYPLGQAVKRKNGSWWQLISPEMATVFGTFGGIGSIQRSTPRWVEPSRVKVAADFIQELR